MDWVTSTFFIFNFWPGSLSLSKVHNRDSCPTGSDFALYNSLSTSVQWKTHQSCPLNSYTVDIFQFLQLINVLMFNSSQTCRPLSFYPPSYNTRLKAWFTPFSHLKYLSNKCSFLRTKPKRKSFFSVSWHFINYYLRFSVPFVLAFYQSKLF